MEVSVVVCTYSMDRFDVFCEAVESVQDQTYDAVEIVLVVDGNEDVFDRVRSRFGDDETVVCVCNDDNRGVSYSRTRGAEIASGDVVAFIDDDAVADPEWVEQLVQTYESTDAIAAGGRLVGDWRAGNPWYLPAEFYWLVGVTHPNFATHHEEVRNTFESNISFRRDVFLALGGFDPELGPTSDRYLHSEGAELCARMQERYGSGVVYNSNAVVEHKVFEHRIQPRWLLRRAFQQGYSKRLLESIVDDSGGEEGAFLKELFTHSVPTYGGKAIRSRSLMPVTTLLMLLILTGFVGLGYLYALSRSLTTSAE
ncbi:glycosyltransferase AglG [Natrialba magadii ATCC 43099]|uniref:Family 2 glycosyl transferase n=1 Tax=Natrialba magadii (strain ATCC 43099 / DSM 3394 / CCM 3739 / CIP 104546 / IAM 13178 / JCM 8861 / NBRC 102185 / NCIMB 2190 / MS3) TaxID=547559 RepID=D3SQM2_NATMM|nr:glucosyl-dolichyl phosphate glucuronosyltransferase [Natrialba magadii]ADD04510.1 glycosyltransferase AglG [Natrialba magadii ATCC 43099]ELY25167.1 family 2 glycosyl transferase [Natrialba magadii ATCC 43099]